MDIREILDRNITEMFDNISLPQRPAGLYDPIRYTLRSGGKRLRPSLLLASVIAFGGDPEKARSQCIGIEMFHNFTLLHDDVMDNSDVRRGQLTVHRRWNANTAILSGDAMLTLATRYIAECSPEQLPEVLSTFNSTAMKIYEGQQLDMDFEEQETVTVDSYIEMITLKTSVLLGGALKIGAILAGATKEDAEAIYNYGINLGVAFQLRDDYLDTFGDPLIFGKELGGDILNDKKTWLMITALSEDTSGRMRDALDSKYKEEGKIAVVTEVYRELGLDTRVLSLISRYCEEANRSLEGITMREDARKYFTELTGRMAERMH